MVLTAKALSATSVGQLENDELALFLSGLTDLSRPIINTYFRALPDIMTKADSSPVTIADRSVEQALRATITAQFPDDMVMGEEFGSDDSAGISAYKWVIDPIDGTKAFVSGKPAFGTLVGVTHNDRPIAGLIDIPVLDETYIGTADGSVLNGDKLQQSMEGFAKLLKSKSMKALKPFVEYVLDVYYSGVEKYGNQIEASKESFEKRWHKAREILLTSK